MFKRLLGKIVLIILLVLIFTACGGSSKSSISSSPRPPTGRVTLDAKYGDEVPMYNQQGFEIKVFTNGVTCTQVDGEMYFFEGSKDAYHKLNCQGTIGFVYRGDIDF